MSAARATVRILLWLAALLVVVPVLIAQLKTDERRELVGVDLADTRHQEVTFSNPTQGIDLAGLLFLPDGDGPFPAAVVIHGSGTSDRRNRWYLSFVSDLQRHGIAVLLPDKRGSGSSGGGWRSASFEDLATDTLAAIAYLQQRHQPAIARIGLLGVSQGGHIAPIVAAASAEVAFVINLVGSSLPMHEVLLYEETHNLRQMGLLPGISDALARLTTLHLRKVAQKPFWDAVGDFDPLPYWRQVKAPTLALYGAEDTNVPTRASAERLRSLGKPNIEVVICRGSGHPLEQPPEAGDAAFRPDALALMRDFIAASLAVSAGGAGPPRPTVRASGEDGCAPYR